MSFAKRRIARTKAELSAIANLPLVLAALIWRRTALRHVTLVAVTGSVGKTTAKECIAAILSRTAPTFSSARADNGRFALPRLLLGARPKHRFIVAEAGILKPGRMWRSALLLNPNVTVITHVNWQHAVNFHSLQQVAEEKAKLLAPLNSAGLAILNADNPLVAAMAEGRTCRVRTFGIEQEADVLGQQLRAQWPDRLTLTVRDGGEQRLIATRFVGAHWAPSVLAAVAAARALGASWEDCTEALAQVEPFPARLSALRLPSGADLLRDEYNGSFATFRKALELLDDARCLRKIIAIGHIRDTPQFGQHGPEEVGRAVAAAGHLLLAWGFYSERYRDAAIAAGAAPESVVLFASQPEMADYIRRETKDGDLILLKGYWNDHMTRIAYSQFGSVQCTLSYCSRHHVCDSCDQLQFQLSASVNPALVKPLLGGQARISKP